jgi:hypothetical protein
MFSLEKSTMYNDTTENGNGRKWKVLTARYGHTTLSSENQTTLMMQATFLSERKSL